MKTFIVRETIVREFEVEADSADDAYQEVMHNETLEHTDESQGIAVVIEVANNQETIY